MTLYTALSEVPAGYGPSVVTIGNFDGVHRGHARVISRVVSLAEEHGLSSIAVSFDPHPMQVHVPRRPTTTLWVRARAATSCACWV